MPHGCGDMPLDRGAANREVSEPESKEVKMHLKLEPSLYEALRELAQSGGRTIAGEVRWALRAHVKAQTSVSTRVGEKA